MNLLQQAENWVAQGIGVIPVLYGGKRPDLGALRFTGSVDAAGRAVWEPFKHRLPSPTELGPWFGSRYRRNIGIVTGWRDLVVLDFDNNDAYQGWLTWAIAQEVEVFNSYTVKTGRGWHVYLTCPGAQKYKHPGILDVQAGGEIVVGAGSLHGKTGKTYTALFGDDAPIFRVADLRAVLPDFLQPPPHTEQARAPQARLEPRCNVAANPASDSPWNHIDGRRPPTLIATALKAARIEDFLPPLRPTGGSWFMTCCPLHDDQNPSMWVNLDTQLCGCRTGCNGGKPLDVVNLVALLHGCSLSEAAQWLIVGRGC